MLICWLTVTGLIAIHGEIIDVSGGSPGVLDEGALESTVNRPLNLHQYTQESDLRVLAASLGYGLVKNHCFVDGNKRIALIAVYTFLAINGVELDAPEAEAASFFLDLAATLDPQEQAIEHVAQWLKTYS